MIGGPDDGPLRRAHAAFVVRASAVLLALFSLFLLRAGLGWRAVLLGVLAWVVVAASAAVTGSPWPDVPDDAVPDRPPRATHPADVAPVVPADLRPGVLAAAGRAAAGVVAFALSTAARDAALVDRYPQIVGSAGIVGDVVVVHLDPGTDDPAVVTESGRRSLVSSANKVTPGEAERMSAGAHG